MTDREYKQRNIDLQNKLLENELKYGKEWTQLERDMWNLQYMRYGIDRNSILYKNGCISSLDRAIESLQTQFWHKPEDRPRNWMDVLLCYEDIEDEVFICPSYHIVSGYYSNESESYIYPRFNRDFVNKLGRTTVKLVGWMPLPEPPC